MAQPVSPLSVSKRGRPHKFGRAARAVTVTLPDDVLARLESIDGDIGRAIVKLIERLHPTTPVRAKVPLVEVAQYGRHAVILVTPTPELRRLPGVSLVPVPAGRALIALESAGSVAGLELQVRDLVDKSGQHTPSRAVLTELASVLQRARASRDLTLEQRNIIVLVPRGRAPRAVKKRASRTSG